MTYFIITFICLCVMADKIYCSHNLFVDTSDGTNTTSCWSGKIPCSTLELGLEGLQYFNHTTLWITSTTKDYVIEKLKKFEYINMLDIAIVVDGKDFVSVKCDREMALNFYNSKNITLKGLKMIGCGALQISTSKNFSKHDEFQFLQFYAVLYFLYCEGVYLDTIVIKNSNGIGAVFYSTVGRNIIDTVDFSHNVALKDSHLPGGGGLYIEFSYCTPSASENITDSNNCSESNVPERFRQNAEYRILNSTFSQNQASIIHTNEYTFILPQQRNHLAFGRGGGISVFFKGNTTNNSILITNCTIENNTALWGAGLFIEYQDMTHDNRVMIKGSIICFNKVWDSTSENSTGGGGARVSYIFFGETHSYGNLVSFKAVLFTGNVAYFGGGLSFETARENTSTATNRLVFKNCTWEDNTARVGTAVDLSVWHPVSKGSIVEPSFTNCIFRMNSANYVKETFNGTVLIGIGALFTDSIPVLFSNRVEFFDNEETALAALGTGIYFDKNTVAVFHNNTGRKGGALALLGYAFVQVSENTILNFIKNSATIRGGAIYSYSIGEHDLIATRNCIIRYDDIFSTPNEWNATFYFEDNLVNNKTNSIYLTSVLNCLWGGNFSSIQEGTSKVFCWNGKNITRWKYTTGNCTDNIATSPAKFVPKSNMSPESSYYHLNVIPGKRERLPFYTEDDQGSNTTKDTVLIAQVEENDHLYLDSTSVYIANNSILLHGNINTTGTLRVETTNHRVISTSVNVTVTECPPGMFLNANSSCECGSSYNSLVKCDTSKFTVKLKRGAWMGVFEGTVLASDCPYCAAILKPFEYETILHSDPNKLQENICGKINRAGVLCGKCAPNYGPTVNSKDFHCIKCDQKMTKNWSLFFLNKFIPITILFFIVILLSMLKIGLTSGPANGFVFFAQMITAALVFDGDGWLKIDDTLPGGSAADNVLRVLPYDIWNLNFFEPYLPEFCLSSNISTLQLMAIEYITALFPLALVGLAFILSYLDEMGYFSICHRINCNCKQWYTKAKQRFQFQSFYLSIIHTLATFTLLSYTKFTLVSFNLLSSIPLLYDNGTYQSYRLYFQGDIEFGSREHLPYLFLAIFVLLTFVAIPPVLLVTPSIKRLLYKCSESCKCPHGQPSEVSSDRHFCSCCRRSRGKLDQFLMAFYNCYKDGTGGPDGKIDFRWFAGWYFIYRIILVSLYALCPDWFFQIVIQQIACILGILAFVIFRPYKEDLYNYIDAMFFGILAILCSLSLQNYYSSVAESKVPAWTFVIQFILLTLPLLYIISVFIYLVGSFIFKAWKPKKNDVVIDSDLCDTLNYMDIRQAESSADPHSPLHFEGGYSQPLLANEQLPAQFLNMDDQYKK